MGGRAGKTGRKMVLLENKITSLKKIKYLSEHKLNLFQEKINYLSNQLFWHKCILYLIIPLLLGLGMTYGNNLLQQYKTCISDLDVEKGSNNLWKITLDECRASEERYKSEAILYEAQLSVLKNNLKMYLEYYEELVNSIKDLELDDNYFRSCDPISYYDEQRVVITEANKEILRKGDLTDRSN